MNDRHAKAEVETKLNPALHAARRLASNLLQAVGLEVFKEDFPLDFREEQKEQAKQLTFSIPTIEAGDRIEIGILHDGKSSTYHGLRGTGDAIVGPPTVSLRKKYEVHLGILGLLFVLSWVASLVHRETEFKRENPELARQQQELRDKRTEVTKKEGFDASILLVVGAVVALVPVISSDVKRKKN